MTRARAFPAICLLSLAVVLGPGCGSCDEPAPSLSRDLGPDGGAADASLDDGAAAEDALPADGATSDGETLDHPDLEDTGLMDMDGTAGDGGPGLDGGDGGGGADGGGGLDGTMGGGGDGGPGLDASGTGDAGPDPTRNDRDFDCDGVSDLDEATLGTNPTQADSDGDGLTDGVELGRDQPVPGAGCTPTFLDADPGTVSSPLSPDTDGDGIPDGVEDRDHDGARAPDELSPSSSDTDGDLLPDGLEDRNLNGRVDAFESDGTRADTDQDGIPDGVEDLDHDGVLDGGESSPIFADTDFDGLPDGVEDANHDGGRDPGETSAVLYDSDFDGLSDGCEDRDHDGALDPGESSPLAADSDLDGLLDGEEDADHDCVLDPAETDPGSSDSDCDGLSDLTELSTSYAGIHTSARAADSDGDLITDGVESGVIAAVPGSGCATVLIDRQPSTRTDPTLFDTDGDGRSDGCEDRNRNGRLDGNELNPLATDTDGDGLSDAAEDQNGNCRREAAETNGTLADTDGDGIGDGIELALGTSPINADTDGDGLPDGLEDANQNGVVEPGETNPLVADTDGDGLADGTEDANHNGTVDPGETNPRTADTDGDGLSDAAEVAQGTNPLDADSDNDNLPDGAEGPAGTNPLDPDSDNDGVLDGDEVIAGTDPLDPLDPSPTGASGINAVCSAGGLKVVQLQDDAAGDWQLALETTQSYVALTVSGGHQAAAFDDNAAGVSGLVLNTPLPAAGNATAQAQALIARLSAGLATLGATSVTTANNGRQVSSHDGFAAQVDVRVQIALSPGLSVPVARNRVLAVLANRPLGAFSGLPGAAGPTTAEVVVRFEALIRAGAAPRLVVVGGVAARSRFDDTALTVRQNLEDLSNGTVVARAYATNHTGCDPFPVSRDPRADFIWMADISASTDNDRGTIAAAAGAIFTGLVNNGVDFRMGVVPHHRNRVANPATAGQLRSGFTRSQTTFINDLNNITGTDGCEWGLTAADDAVLRALPRTIGAENANRLRDGAQLVVFYISDEHAQEVEQSQCGLGVTGTGLTDIFYATHEQAPPAAAQQSVIDGIVAPFVSTLQANQGIAFAQLHPLQAPFCFIDFPTDEEEGYGYYEAVNATGGTFYRVCDANPGSVLLDIINAVSGGASEFVLQETPISSTIKVGLTRAGSNTTVIVPRSAVDGFDYDPVANSVFFHGATNRPAVGDQVTISYRIFGPPSPPVVCAPPLVLNTVTGTCDCPADCGVGGGCGAGRICDRNPGACACICEPDCGGTCRGSQVCNTTSCACECAPNCGGGCAPNEVCDTTSCTCSCPADCGGTCINNQVCNLGTCGCVCPPACGGTCGLGQSCDPASCACVGAPL